MIRWIKWRCEIWAVRYTLNETSRTASFLFEFSRNYDVWDSVEPAVVALRIREYWLRVWLAQLRERGMIDPKRRGKLRSQLHAQVEESLKLGRIPGGPNE